MKIIHTADWHIGKIVNEFSMIDDQRYILNSLIDLIKEEKPDVLVIAGDLYDRSIPPVEAVELLDEVFNRILLELKTPVLAIAGNHDGAERLSFGSRLLINNGLYISGIFDGEAKKAVLEDKFGQVNFYLLPYADPRQVKHIMEDDEITSHNIAFKKVIDKIKSNMKDNGRNVLVAHGYITKLGENTAETCDSERPLSIGGTDLVDYESFTCFNYTALGHLHGPQRVGEDKIRYSGSLLKYSFSETNHKKGVTIVDINEKGEALVKHMELHPKRDMRIIKGPINSLIDPAVYKEGNTNDYVYATLTDEGELVDPISKLRAVYPNIMGLGRENSEAREKSRTAASEGYKTKSKAELFEEFFLSINGTALSDEGRNVINDVVEAVTKEGY